MDNELEDLRRRVALLEVWRAEIESAIATLPDSLRKAFEADATQGGEVNTLPAGDARDPG